MKKIEIYFAYHLILITLLIFLLLIVITGILAHEVMAIVFFVMVCAHILFCHTAYKNAFLAAFNKKRTAIDIARIVVIMLCVITLFMQYLSGIFLSRYIFGPASANRGTWLGMHAWVSRILVALVIILIALYIKPLTALIGKNTYVKSEK